MSVCGQNGHQEEESASEETGVPSREDYKQKPASKVVRVLTVLAYLLSVSLAAILLSVYYVCVWKSPELPREDTVQISARRANFTQYAHTTYFHDSAGGVNSTVREPVSEPSTADDYESSNAGPAGATNDTLDLTTAAEPSLQPHYNTTDDDSPFNHTTTNT